MSIVTIHGPYTFGSKAIIEVGAAQAVVSPTNGLIWTFKLDRPSTRTASLAWTFPTGTPASATGPGPHNVTFASAGSKAVTAVATGAGEGANPYPPAGTTNIPVTAVSGAVPTLMLSPEDDGEGNTISVEEFQRGEGEPGDTVVEPQPQGNGEDPDVVDVGYDPAAHTVTEVIGFVEDNPDELDDIIAAEEAGKARVTLLTHLESMREA